MTFTNFFPIWKTWGATDELMFNLCWRDLNICLLDGSISSLNLCWAPVSCWCSTMIRGILVLLLWAILTLLLSMLTLLVYAHWGSLKQPVPAFLFQGCSRIQITLDLGRSVRTESHFFLNSAQYLFFFLCAVFNGVWEMMSCFAFICSKVGYSSLRKQPPHCHHLLGTRICLQLPPCGYI